MNFRILHIHRNIIQAYFDKLFFEIEIDVRPRGLKNYFITLKYYRQKTSEIYSLFKDGRDFRYLIRRSITSRPDPGEIQLTNSLISCLEKIIEESEITFPSIRGDPEYKALKKLLNKKSLVVARPVKSKLCLNKNAHVKVKQKSNQSEG